MIHNASGHHELEVQEDERLSGSCTGAQLTAGTLPQVMTSLVYKKLRRPSRRPHLGPEGSTFRVSPVFPFQTVLWAQSPAVEGN